MAGVSYDDAVVALRARLGEKALGHSLRVADTAAGLAATYDVDVDRARLAGLLHDWDRERSADELMDSARDAGVTITPADEAVPYLLHARTGAASLAEAMPGLDQAVVRAVALHTVGAPDMTALDMVVYVADMIEPARDFPGVLALRDAVGVASLRELFVLAYRRSLLHLVESGRRIHPDTVAVWNSLVAGGRP